jgi:serine/threonine protein kinase/Tol biopolymer transport system component
LNHPHICALYDIGQQNGFDFLVMEYLEGETLANRLLKAALPLDQAFRYAIEIADALEQAHRHGITHRDLKPGNVMLTRSGAKLLDFGLAKLRGPEPVWSDHSSLPTEARALTEKGTLLGTLQYMAPEQLEGKEADARTDIFAFGALLYEMGTGRKAFEGKSQASLIAAILEHEPQPISTLQPMTPPALDRVVKKCLVKDPEERWQSAHDLRYMLKWIAEAGSQTGLGAAALTRRSSRSRLAWVVAAFGILAALGFAAAYFHRTPAKVRAIRFTIPPPEKTDFRYTLSISPDGRLLVSSVMDVSGQVLLWVRPLDSLSAQPLPGTENGTLPFWSPDSRFVGFFAAGKLKKLEVSGGTPQTLCDAPAPWIGTWNRNGVILFTPSLNSPLYRVSAAGGKAVPVTTLDPSRQEVGHRFPQFLPDGRHFLYLVSSAQKENSAIYVGSLDSKQTQRLLGADSNVAYAPPGYLLYVRGGTLLAQPFEARDLQLTGEPLPVAQQVLEAQGAARFSVSENGVLVYRSGAQKTQLVWLDRGGRQLSSIGAPGYYLCPWLSPEENRVAVQQFDPQTRVGDIWLLDLLRGTSSRLTFDQSEDYFPIWSPDGSRIAYSKGQRGLRNLYQKLSSGAGNEEILLESTDSKVPEDWSPDGRFITYTSFNLNNPKNQSDLWVLPLFGERKPIPYLQSEFNEVQARFSPDGRWIATAQTSRAGRRCMCGASRPLPTSRRSQRTAGLTPAGERTAKSCSMWIPTRSSWRWRYERVQLSSPGHRGRCSRRASLVLLGTTTP